MSFRPLTISAPIYRAYATMRLEDIQPWVQEWGLPEMHAGVPGVGAADAWHDATTEIEELKINDEGFVELSLISQNSLTKSEGS